MGYNGVYCWVGSEEKISDISFVFESGWCYELIVLIDKGEIRYGFVDGLFFGIFFFVEDG